MLDNFAISQMSVCIDPTFGDAMQALYESLPAGVKRTFDAAKSFDDLRRAAEDIAKNRLLLNALELTMLLAKIFWSRDNAKDMFAARAHDSEYNVVREMWWVKVEVHCEKCQKAAVLAELIKKYSGLSACIHSWEFSSVPWVMEEKNAERDKLCKDVQEVLMQLDVLSNTLDRVTRAMESWAEKAELQVTADALKVTMVAQLQVRTCQVLVGEMILVGMFVQGERAGKTVEQVRDGADFKPAVQYVTKTLKLSVADMDKNLPVRQRTGRCVGFNGASQGRRS